MPRIPAAIAVVLTVAACIGFNTVRYPVVLEMAAPHNVDSADRPTPETPEASAQSQSTDAAGACGSQPGGAESGESMISDQPSNSGEVEDWADPAQHDPPDYSWQDDKSTESWEYDQSHDSWEDREPTESREPNDAAGSSCDSQSCWSDDSTTAGHTNETPVSAEPQSRYGTSAASGDQKDEIDCWNAGAELVPVTDDGGWLRADVRGETTDRTEPADQARHGGMWPAAGRGVGVKRLPPVGAAASQPSSAALPLMSSGTIPLYPSTRQP